MINSFTVMRERKIANIHTMFKPLKKKTIISVYS